MSKANQLLQPSVTIVSENSIECDDNRTTGNDANSADLVTKITVFSRKDRKTAGKTIRSDGSKDVANHTGIYTAETVELRGATAPDLLARLDALIAALDSHQLITLGYAHDMPERYHVQPVWFLKQETGTDGTGIYRITPDGLPTIARLKVHYTPSRIRLLDFDPHEAMPANWHGMDADARFQLLCDAVPQWRNAARLVMPSSSGRVLDATGRPLKRITGEHSYIVLDSDIDAQTLDSLRSALEVRIENHGLGYTTESSDGKTLRRALIDLTPFITGHEVYCAAPCVHAPYQLAPRTSYIRDGGCAGIITEISEKAARKYSKRTGGKVEKTSDGKGSRIILEDTTQLTLRTPIETQHNGVMTVQEFLDSGFDKLRCQSPFRESTSFAAFIRRTKHGCMVVDTGDANRRYTLSSNPDELTGTWKRDIQKLEAASPAQAPALARAIVFRHSWRCPHQLSYRNLYRSLCAANESVSADDIKPLIHWIADRARKKAVAAVTIDDDQLPENVTVRHAQSIEEIRAEIEKLGAGIHVIKAPHGIGKTQKLLAPIALAMHAVLGIAPRRTLVTALGKYCNLPDYREAGSERGSNLAICLNSIVNSMYGAVQAPSVVLCDEIARMSRDTHDATSTHGKKARAVWDKLTTLMRNARLTVAVDADINTSDVAMLAKDVGSMTVWIVSETPRTLLASYVSVTVIQAAIDRALDKNETVWITTDSADEAFKQANVMRERHPNKAILAIHDKAGCSTLGTPEVHAFLKDPNGQAPLWDCVIASPAIESGFSIETAHFSRHFALYSGVLEPSAFNQALLRDRTATEWRIAIKNNGKNSRPDSKEAALNALDSTQRIIKAIDGNYLVIPATEYDSDCMSVMSASVASRNRYAADLWFLLENRGWTVEIGNLEYDEIGAEIRHEAKALAHGASITSIAQAQSIDADTAARLKKKHTVTPDESAALARHDVAQSTGRTTADVTIDDIKRWNQGAMIGWNRHFDALTSETTGLTERDAHEATAAVPLALRSHDAALSHIWKALFSALGICPHTGTGDITAASALAAWRALRDTDEGRALSRFGVASFKGKEPVRPISWVSAALRRLGLYLKGDGARQDRTYRIAQSGMRYKTLELGEPVQFEHGVIYPDAIQSITALGFMTMLEIQQRRAALAQTAEDDCYAVNKAMRSRNHRDTNTAATAKAAA